MNRADHFESDCWAATERLKKEINYYPARWCQMLADHGGVEAARRILAMKGSSDGFTRLWETGRLDQSVEALIALPWYAQLFTEAERAEARQWLQDYGFDVETYLTRMSSRPPEWEIESRA